MLMPKKLSMPLRNKGFTIVELLIVIIVIGILAAVVVVSYQGIQKRASTATLMNDLAQASQQLGQYRNSYPSDLSVLNNGQGLKKDPSTVIDYSTDGASYCMNATSAAVGENYYVTDRDTAPQVGSCDKKYPITDLDANGNNTCAVSNAKPYCWGWNWAGQLGNNTTVDSSVPVAVDTSGVLNGKTVTAVTSGSSHSCAIANGSIYCWGSNSNGQLGNNSTTGSLVPVAVNTSGVLSGKTVTAIDADSTSTCAIASGKAYCWGFNGFGQIGNNSTTQSLVPVAVNTSGVLNGKTVTAISRGGGHTCAVASGSAYCWGKNDSGEIGNNTVSNWSLVPVAVNTSGVLSGKTVTAISIASQLSCAIADARAYCWGTGGEGLGNNSAVGSSPSYVPVPVAVDTSGVLNGKSVTSISVGGYGTVCAVADGNAYCWGGSRDGLGNNSSRKSAVPVAVDTSGVLNGKSITETTSTTEHTCALATGRSFCWGFNTYGQLGNNSKTNSPLPVATFPLP